MYDPNTICDQLLKRNLLNVWMRLLSCAMQEGIMLMEAAVGDLLGNNITSLLIYWSATQLR